MINETNPALGDATQTAIGIAGLPSLPWRDPLVGRRFIMTIAKVRRELGQYLPDARDQAAEELQALISENAPAAQIDDARQLLNVMRHAKGPMFQALLLAQLGVRKIEVVIKTDQSALERALEIASGLAIAIQRQPRCVVEQAILALHKPLDPAEFRQEQSTANKVA